jgi:hypothetical protein
LPTPEKVLFFCLAFQYEGQSQIFARSVSMVASHFQGGHNVETYRKQKYGAWGARLAGGYYQPVEAGTEERRAFARHVLELTKLMALKDAACFHNRFLRLSQVPTPFLSAKAHGGLQGGPFPRPGKTQPRMPAWRTEVGNAFFPKERCKK